MTNLQYGNILETKEGKIYIFGKDQSLRIDVVPTELILNKNINNVVKIYKDYTLKEVLWEKPKALLTDEEKIYITMVLSPYDLKVDYIIKQKIDDYTSYLQITFTNADCMNFPTIPTNLHYVNMELDTEYTLEELGF